MAKQEENMAYQTFQQEYMQMPPITRAYTTACVLTTLAVVSRNNRDNFYKDLLFFVTQNSHDVGGGFDK